MLKYHKSRLGLGPQSILIILQDSMLFVEHGALLKIRSANSPSRSTVFLDVVGLRVSNATFNAIVMRYSNRHGEVRFADFVACVIKLKTLFGKLFIASLRHTSTSSTFIIGITICVLLSLLLLCVCVWFLCNEMLQVLLLF